MTKPVRVGAPRPGSVDREAAGWRHPAGRRPRVQGRSVGCSSLGERDPGAAEFDPSFSVGGGTIHRPSKASSSSEAEEIGRAAPLSENGLATGDLLIVVHRAMRGRSTSSTISAMSLFVRS